LIPAAIPSSIPCNSRSYPETFWCAAPSSRDLIPARLSASNSKSATTESSPWLWNKAPPIPQIASPTRVNARLQSCNPKPNILAPAMNNHFRLFSHCLFAIVFLFALSLRAQDAPHSTQLPNGKLLADVPGHPRPTNNLPTAIALSPDGRFAVLLHSGFGAYTSGEKQSLSVLNLETDELADFPDDRLGSKARQTYFLGLAFSLDGKHLFASMASLTDPLGKQKGSTGNGVAVYAFENGRVIPERFLPLPPRAQIPAGKIRRPQFQDVTYPSGLA